MVFSGQIYEHTETGIADLTAEVSGDYLIVKVIVNSQTVIRFPMPPDTDSNELTLRATNIINQTGLVANSCRVEIEP